MTGKGLNKSGFFGPAPILRDRRYAARPPKASKPPDARRFKDRRKVA